MYCPTCGNEITIELNYCKRCGANLSLPVTAMTPAPPVKLTAPSLVLGLTIVCGLGIVFGGVTELASQGIHPIALAWIVIASMAMLFGFSGLLIRFWSKMASLPRALPPQPLARQQMKDRVASQQLPPHFEPVPSVTENTTRTFSPIYREPLDR
jgi:hypothetical protein